MAGLQFLYRALNHVVFAVDEAEIVVESQNIAYKHSLYLPQEQSSALVDVIPACRHTLCCCIIHKLLKQGIVVRQRAQQLLHILGIAHCFAIAVGKLHGETGNESAVRHLGII